MQRLPALQIPKGLCLSPLHAQKVGGARHVDVQKGSAHEEIGRLGRDVLGELRQPLGGDDPRKPAFAATAHQVRRGAEREFARLVQNLAGDCRCEELRLIQHQQYRVPVSRCCFYARPNTGGEVRRFMRRIDFRSRLVGGKITLQP